MGGTFDHQANVQPHVEQLPYYAYGDDDVIFVGRDDDDSEDDDGSHSAECVVPHVDDRCWCTALHNITTTPK